MFPFVNDMKQRHPFPKIIQPYFHFNDKEVPEAIKLWFFEQD